MHELREENKRLEDGLQKQKAKDAAEIAQLRAEKKRLDEQRTKDSSEIVQGQSALRAKEAELNNCRTDLKKCENNSKPPSGSFVYWLVLLVLGVGSLVYLFGATTSPAPTNVKTPTKAVTDKSLQVGEQKMTLENILQKYGTNHLEMRIGKARLDKEFSRIVVEVDQCTDKVARSALIAELKRFVYHPQGKPLSRYEGKYGGVDLGDGCTLQQRESIEKTRKILGRLPEGVSPYYNGGVACDYWYCCDSPHHKDVDQSPGCRYLLCGHTGQECKCK